jgi:cytochrome c
MKACGFLHIVVLAGMSLGATVSGAAAQGGAPPDFQVCAGCHSVGAGDKVEGPNLKGIVGRKVAAQSGFKYSPAMRAFAAKNPVWTETLLDSYLKNPNEVVPGTSMANAPAIRRSKSRQAIVEYLKAQK